MKGKRTKGQGSPTKYPRPKWVIREVERLKKQYGKTVQAKFVNGVWQARLVWSQWDKEKKKPVKKEKYLGVIKETGFVPKHRKYTRGKRKQERKQKQMDDLHIKITHPGWENVPSYVWGADRIGREALKGVWEQIERLFDQWESNVLKALSLTWGVWGVLPMKSTYRFWNRLWSQREVNATLQPQTISEVLEYVGRRPNARLTMGAWFLSLHPDRPLLFDMTHLFTWSEGIDSSCLGWNAEKKWLPQVRTAVLSAGDRPVILEMAGGNLHEIHMLQHLQESLFESEKISKPLTLVSDRACASSKLVERLLSAGHPFVLPLRKNMVSDELYGKTPEQYFKFCKRRIGWLEEEHKIGGHSVRLLLFHDPVLGGHQVNTYRARYMDEAKDREWLEERERRAGWIALWTNTDMKPGEVFEIYKMRQHVEEVVDRIRNHILAEGSYMRNDDQLQGWLWVVLLALQVHWYILDRLKTVGLLKRWSVDEVLRELREIRKEPTPAGWRLTPVSRGVRNMLAKLGFDKLIWA